MMLALQFIPMRRISLLLRILAFILVLNHVNGLLSQVDEDAGSERMDCQSIIDQARDSFYTSSEINEVNSIGIFYVTQADREFLNMKTAKCLQFKSKAFTSELYIIDVSQVT